MGKYFKVNKLIFSKILIANIEIILIQTKKKNVFLQKRILK